MSTLVLGIGNTLLSDEGVGVAAMQEVARRLAGRSDVECIDGGTLSFSLAGPIAAHDALIVIDAAELGAPPGAVRVFVGPEMDAFLGANRKRSVHEVSLLDLMAVAELEGLLPARRALIGIQPANLDWGETLSPPLAAALPRAGDEAVRLIENWNP
jgi:hydrogenase maturation protease